MSIGELLKQEAYMEKIVASSPHMFIVTHGGREGIDSPFIQGVFHSLHELGHSVVTFNFSYLLTNDEVSMGLEDELRDLHDMYQQLKERLGNKKMHLVGKSLGGIVSSWLPHRFDVPEIESISILGYVPSRVDLRDFKKKVLVIQGADDQFGGKERVLEDTQRFQAPISISEIPCADHSFRCTQTTGNTHQDKAIETLTHLLRQEVLL